MEKREREGEGNKKHMMKGKINVIFIVKEKKVYKKKRCVQGRFITVTLRESSTKGKERIYSTIL